MAYTSFTEAWNAYVVTYGQEKTSYTTVTNAIEGINNSTTWTTLRSWTATLGSALRNWILLHGRTQWPTWQESSYYSALYFAGQGGASITMADILTAMLRAEYEELQQFVGIEDAYRSAIWEQPFNAEYYAALARGFMR